MKWSNVETRFPQPILLQAKNSVKLKKEKYKVILSTNQRRKYKIKTQVPFQAPQVPAKTASTNERGVLRARRARDKTRPRQPPQVLREPRLQAVEHHAQTTRL